eukprot:scaffold175820_cov32-Tisochrysis_lutea.AAC.1
MAPRWFDHKNGPATPLQYHVNVCIELPFKIRCTSPVHRQSTVAMMNVRPSYPASVPPRCRCSSASIHFLPGQSRSSAFCNTSRLIVPHWRFFGLISFVGSLPFALYNIFPLDG